MGDRRCCCGSGCVLVDDHFDFDTIGNYTQVSGIWWISDGSLRTSSDPAFIVRSVPGLTQNYIVEADVLGGTDGDIVGLVFGCDSDDDYLKITLTVEDTADYCGTLKIVHVKAAIESTIYETTLLGLRTDQFHNIRVCVLGDGAGGAAIDVFLTRSTGKSFEYRFSIEDSTLGDKVGFVVDDDNNTGTSQFDNLYVAMHYLSDPKCPACDHPCQIAYYDNHTANSLFSDVDLDCEWSLYGSVVSSGHTMYLTGTARADLLIPHPDGAAESVVEATVQADTNGQKIRIYANVDIGGSGPYGELDFTTGGEESGILPMIRVSNGTIVNEFRFDLELDVPYNLRLCSTVDRVALVILTGSDDWGYAFSVRPGNLAGKYAAVESINGGVAAVTRFLYERYRDPDTDIICDDCWESCDVCENDRVPPDMVCTVSGLKGAPHPNWSPFFDIYDGLCDVSTFGNIAYYVHMNNCVGCSCLFVNWVNGECNICGDPDYNCMIRLVSVGLSFYEELDDWVVAAWLLVESYVPHGCPGFSFSASCQRLVAGGLYRFPKEEYPDGIPCENLDITIVPSETEYVDLLSSCPPVLGCTGSDPDWVHPHQLFSYMFANVTIRVQSA